METALVATVALVAVVVTALLVRAHAQRQLAEARAEMAAALAVSKQDLRDAFQSVATDALKDNRSAFLDLARTSFAAFQQPIADTLKKVDVSG